MVHTIYSSNIAIVYYICSFLHILQTWEIIDRESNARKKFSFKLEFPRIT